jgi:hypothetical protein
MLSDDSDFGITSLSTNTQTRHGSWELQAKLLPDGSVDAGGFLRVDMRKVPAAYR